MIVATLFKSKFTNVSHWNVTLADYYDIDDYDHYDDDDDDNDNNNDDDGGGGDDDDCDELMMRSKCQNTERKSKRKRKKNVKDNQLSGKVNIGKFNEANNDSQMKRKQEEK